MLYSDSMAWFSNLKVLLLFFFINCLEYNNKRLAAVSNIWLLELEDQAMCVSNVKVVHQLFARLNSFLFILLDYFWKYFYLSSFKTTTFLLLLKYFFWLVLCTLLQVVFSSVTKLLFDYSFWVFYTPLAVYSVNKSLNAFTIHVSLW